MVTMHPNGSAIVDGVILTAEQVREIKSATPPTGRTGFWIRDGQNKPQQIHYLGTDLTRVPFYDSTGRRYFKAQTGGSLYIDYTWNIIWGTF